MPPIDLRLVHEEIREFFKDNTLTYSLTARAKLDCLARTYAPSYIADTKHSSKVAQHELAVIVVQEYLYRFHNRVSLFQEDTSWMGGHWRFELEENEIAKIHEEDRRIEELEVWRY